LEKIFLKEIFWRIWWKEKEGKKKEKGKENEMRRYFLDLQK